MLTPTPTRRRGGGGKIGPAGPGRGGWAGRPRPAVMAAAPRGAGGGGGDTHGGVGRGAVVLRGTPRLAPGGQRPPYLPGKALDERPAGQQRLAAMQHDLDSGEVM